MYHVNTLCNLHLPRVNFIRVIRAYFKPSNVSMLHTYVTKVSYYFDNKEFL